MISQTRSPQRTEIRNLILTRCAAAPLRDFLDQLSIYDDVGYEVESNKSDRAKRAKFPKVREE